MRSYKYSNSDILQRHQKHEEDVDRGRPLYLSLSMLVGSYTSLLDAILSIAFRTICAAPVHHLVCYHIASTYVQYKPQSSTQNEYAQRLCNK